MLFTWCCRNKEKELEKQIQLQNEKAVKKLLSQGADPNEYGENDCSFLSMTITQRNETLVRMMLKAGASTNQAVWKNVGKPHLREYPLHRAVVQGHKGIIKTLLEHGAEVNIGQDTRVGTPLHQAVQQGHADVTEILLSHNADIIAIDRCLNTPLHYAATYGYTEVAEILLNKGAPVNACNLNLATPLHKAVSRQATSVARLLMTHGADIVTPVNLAPSDNMKNILLNREFNLEQIELKFDEEVDSNNSNNLNAIIDNSTNIDLQLNSSHGNTYAKLRQTESINITNSHRLYQNNLDNKNETQAADKISGKPQNDFSNKMSESWKSLAVDDRNRKINLNRQINNWEARRSKSLHRSSITKRKKVARTQSEEIDRQN